MKGLFNELRAVFITGFIALFILGVIGFLVKVLFVDAPGILLRSPIIAWLGDGWWVDFLIAGFTILAIMLVGAPLHFFIGIQKIINSILEKLSPVADLAILVNWAPGIDFFAFKIKKVIQKKSAIRQRARYVVFTPYSPVPGSGLPIKLVDEDKVTFIQITTRQLVSIIISFGRNVPDILEEGKLKSTK